MAVRIGPNPHRVYINKKVSLYSVMCSHKMVPLFSDLNVRFHMLAQTIHCKMMLFF